MNRMVLVAAALVLAAGIGEAGPKKKVDVPTMVPFATAWDAAVAEAKLLNVPIVLHRHLFT